MAPSSFQKDVENPGISSGISETVEEIKERHCYQYCSEQLLQIRNLIMYSICMTQSPLYIICKLFSGYNQSKGREMLVQSWRRQVNLLQVPHLFIWHFTPFITGEPSINKLPVSLIEGKPSINAYFSLIFTCMGSHVLNLGHSSYLLLLKLQVIYLCVHYLDFSQTYRKY